MDNIILLYYLTDSWMMYDIEYGIWYCTPTPFVKWTIAKLTWNLEDNGLDIISTEFLCYDIPKKFAKP